MQKPYICYQYEFCSNIPTYSDFLCRVSNLVIYQIQIPNFNVVEAYARTS